MTIIIGSDPPSVRDVQDATFVTHSGRSPGRTCHRGVMLPRHRAEGSDIDLGRAARMPPGKHIS